MRAYCLSVHRRYKCAHSGACCTAGWAIDIEEVKVTALRARGFIIPSRFHMASRKIAPLPQQAAREPSSDSRKMTPWPQQAAREPSSDSRKMTPWPQQAARENKMTLCRFFDADQGRLCAIHRDAGPALMPSACQNFPRIALRDPRGVFVTLSHFCPTAARLLLDPGEIAIVDAPASIALDGAVEGLDATGVMPPLLRPGMLMDLEGYSAWEHQGIAVLNDRACSAAAALAIISAATRDACSWRPGSETLATRMMREFERARVTHAEPERPAHARLERAVKAFLAAHLFASWAAYQQGGLAAIVDSLSSALTLLNGELRDSQRPEDFIAAVRATDLRLRHYRDHDRSGPVPALRRH